MNVDELWFRFRMPLPKQKTDKFNIKMERMQFQNKIASKKKKNIKKKKTSNGRRRKKKNKNCQNVCLGPFLQTRLEHQHILNIQHVWDNIRV